MDLASAIRHLRARVAQIDAGDSRNRPRWAQADLDAVAVLVDIPASAEQIALARIEGMTGNGGYPGDIVKRAHRISRRALGLPVVK
jgi:hypothetical protein